MYVIARVEMEETVSILSPVEPAVSFSVEEFEHYADLFEEILERLEREEAEDQENEPRAELEWSPVLDRFDLAEIADMRERYGLIREA
jgi:hypothetical protein